MTHFLATEDNPSGSKLEEILFTIRNDVLRRSEKIMDDPRSEAQAVLRNNLRILALLSECIEVARDSTRLLDTHFGRPGPEPRIGVP